MSTLTIPNSYSPGEEIASSQMNANFGAIVTWSTTIDNTNIGSAGIFASQIKFATTGEGTIAQGEPLTITPTTTSTIGIIVTSVASSNAATVELNMGQSQNAPALLVNGSNSSNSDIQQWWTKPGGALALSVNWGGVLTFLPGGNPSASSSSVQIWNDAQSTNGMIFGVPGSSTNGWSFAASFSQVAQITHTGVGIFNNQLNPGYNNNPGNSVIFSGAGSPSGTVTAYNGSIFLRSDGGSSARVYVNTSGASTSGTTWTALIV